MEEIAPYLFIQMGLRIRLLRHASGHEKDLVLRNADRLIENLKDAGFPVSLEGLIDLTEFIEKLKQDDDKRVITRSEVSSLTRIMAVVEHMVFAEAKTKKVYVASERRFSLDVLMNYPDRMFSTGVFSRLPEVARFDVAEGFKCLTFARPTASAFHMLRATEAVLKQLYFAYVKRGRERTPMWGNMVKGLAGRRGLEPQLIQRLDYIRSAYRNPTQHPEAVYDLESAQDLLGLCVEAINSMSRAVSKK